MIDYNTWKSQIRAPNAVPTGREYLDPAVMAQMDPPEPMLLLLPHMIQGFNMLEKKWGTYCLDPYSDGPS